MIKHFFFSKRVGEREREGEREKEGDDRYGTG